MKLYHVTTPKKAQLYCYAGCINKPVRGFTTLQGAMAWAIKVGRTVIYKVETNDVACHKLPDHHNAWGEAWWADQDVTDFHCVFSAEKDA